MRVATVTLRIDAVTATCRHPSIDSYARESSQWSRGGCTRAVTARDDRGVRDRAASRPIAPLGPTTCVASRLFPFSVSENGNINPLPVILRPGDLAIALQLLLTPALGYAELAHRTGLSMSEGHKAVRRLEAARLVRAGLRDVHRGTLLTFLQYGAPHAYPVVLGPETRGVPTAHAAPILADLLWPGRDDPPQPVVWPSATGTVRGAAVEPLYPRAAELPDRNPPLYALLALVDALRLGRARERKAATDLLRAVVPGAQAVHHADPAHAAELRQLPPVLADALRTGYADGWRERRKALGAEDASDDAPAGSDDA